MANFLLIGTDEEEHRRLVQELRRYEYACVIVEESGEATAAIERESPDVVVINLAQPVLALPEMKEVVQVCSSASRIALLALIREDQVAQFDVALGFDDFQLYPCRPVELATRLRQMLWRLGKVPQEDEHVVKAGDLIIDTSRYEVFLAGHAVELTFKEYELLRFLAASPDRVYTRETLLNRVWGYDYYGGARTVDVHIRRLRSKIEDKDHLFIETVRNVGYRFRPARPGEG